MGIIPSCSTNLCPRDSDFHCLFCKTPLCYTCGYYHISHHPGHRVKFLSIIDSYFQDLYLTSLRYSTSDNKTNLFIAIKHSALLAVKVQECDSNEVLNKKQEEAVLIRSLRHSNICRCFKSFIYNSKSGCKLIIVMEYCDNDMEEEILSRLVNKKHFSEEELLEYFFELIKALSHMQDLNLVHRDLKPANLLLKESKVKIADFGLSLQTPDTIVTSENRCVGTLAYLSPLLKAHFMKVIQGSSLFEVRHNPFKSDVFSLGLTFLHMASLIQPSLNCGSNLESRISQAVQKLKYSVYVKNIIKKMLVVDETQRMDFRDLQAWIDSGDWVVSNKILEKCLSVNSLSAKSTDCSQGILTERSLIAVPEINGSVMGFKNCVPLTPYKCIAVSEVIKEFDSNELDFEESSLDHIGLGYIVKGVLENGNIRVLNLGKNEIGPEGGRVLGKALNFLVSLKVLKVFNCRLADEGVMWLSKGITHLEEVYLSDNQISCAGCKFLAQNLAGIKVLSLTYNCISDEGAGSMACYLRNSVIEKLFISNNKIGNIGANKMISSLPKTCQKINLQRNLIESDKVKKDSASKAIILI